MLELALRPLALAVLRAPAGRGEVAEARHELVLAEAGRLVERPRGLTVLAPVKMALRTPEDSLEAPLRRRPLVGFRVVVHAHDRA